MQTVILAVTAALIQLIISQSGFAQGNAQITDIEIRASYCLGVATKQYEETELDKRRLPPGDLREHIDSDILQIIAERRSRLRDYLQVTGLLGRRKLEAIEIPLRRGTADATQCYIENMENIAHKKCREQCGPMREADDYRRCDAKCPAPESCARVKRCLEPFLPF